MLQSALRASRSSEAKGIISSRPCMKGRSGQVQRITSTCSRNLKTMIHVCKRSLHSNFTNKCRNNLPCDISEAKASISDKILASTTTAVTQELAACRKRYHQCLWLVDYHPSLFVNAKNKRSSRTINHRCSIILSSRLAVCYFCAVYLSY